jgi:hypothetical protein
MQLSTSMNVSICRTKKCIIIIVLSWVSKFNCLMVVVHGNARCEKAMHKCYSWLN